MRNIRLTLAYEGTNYVGWQTQPNGPSVQAAVETAVRQLTGETVRVIAAGRTDSGVHALGQVANFPTSCSIPTAKLCDALEHHLPDDIAVLHADEVPPDFHATYWAVKKRYRYVILNSRHRWPVLRHYTLRCSQPLDVEVMQSAADELVGTYDFRSFESEYGRRATSVRTVMEASFDRTTNWSAWSGAAPGAPTILTPQSSALLQPIITFDIVADGFLYNMVRAIVGTLLRVGRGQWTTDDMRRILESRDRSQAGETAPACGLYLVHVDYDEEKVQAGTRRSDVRSVE